MGARVHISCLLSQAINVVHIHFSLQLLVVLATILERNPEVELSQSIDLDQVRIFDLHLGSMSIKPSNSIICVKPLVYYHLNEIDCAVLSCGAVCFSVFCKNKLEIFLIFITPLSHTFLPFIHQIKLYLVITLFYIISTVSLLFLPSSLWTKPSNFSPVTWVQETVR